MESALIRRKGDLIELAKQGEFNVIVHGCNCMNTMGKGIARSIRDQFDEAWVADQKTIRGDYNKLGNYSYAVVERNDNMFTVVNAYTQFNYNGVGENKTNDLFEYSAFHLILKKLEHQFFGEVAFGIPMIGMGLAGGNAAVITDLIEKFANRVSSNGGSVTLVEFSK